MTKKKLLCLIIYCQKKSFLCRVKNNEANLLKWPKNHIPEAESDSRQVQWTVPDSNNHGQPCLP